MSSISAGVLSADPAADKIHKKSFHRRNDSGELDVFEAARYFSGYNEAPSSHNNNNTTNNTSTFSQKMMKEDRSCRGGRISLDIPIRHMLHHPQQHPHHHHHHHVVVEKQNVKDKKYKQPSSPGGRLASFLNSLFNQSASKKKKSKSSTTQSMKDHHEEESPGGRRRRRSSISHFRSSSTADAKSIYSSSSSGFRTPPPYNYGQTAASKSCKDLRSYSDHKQQNLQQQVVSLSKYNTNGQVKSTAALQYEEVVLDDKKSNRELSWLDHEKFKYSNGLSEKYKISSDQDHKGLLKRLSEVVDDDDDYDEGADSDSSSDLFELQNYDLGCYSSGLPVYETTNVENIKIRSSGTPISNVSS